MTDDPDDYFTEADQARLEQMLRTSGYKKDRHGFWCLPGKQPTATRPKTNTRSQTEASRRKRRDH
jgi:hypothetical protein